MGPKSPIKKKTWANLVFGWCSFTAIIIPSSACMSWRGLVWMKRNVFLRCHFDNSEKKWLTQASFLRLIRHLSGSGLLTYRQLKRRDWGYENKIVVMVTHGWKSSVDWRRGGKGGGSRQKATDGLNLRACVSVLPRYITRASLRLHFFVFMVQYIPSYLEYEHKKTD